LLADWNQEQLEKHSREIQSYLGNFYLRITSTKILSLVAEATPPASTKILLESLSLENRALFSRLMTLASDVQSSLDMLEIGQALQQIMDILIEVCNSLVHSYTYLTCCPRPTER
jgi:methionyl-tRNA synthetase